MCHFTLNAVQSTYIHSYTCAHTHPHINTACTCVFAPGQEDTRERGIDVYGLEGEKHCSAFQSQWLQTTRKVLDWLIEECQEHTHAVS